MYGVQAPIVQLSPISNLFLFCAETSVLEKGLVLDIIDGCLLGRGQPRVQVGTFLTVLTTPPA